MKLSRSEARYVSLIVCRLNVCCHDVCINMCIIIAVSFDPVMVYMYSDFSARYTTTTHILPKYVIMLHVSDVCMTTTAGTMSIITPLFVILL